jgi:hypothetical protein
MALGDEDTIDSADDDGGVVCMEAPGGLDALALDVGEARQSKVHRSAGELHDVLDRAAPC